MKYSQDRILTTHVGSLPRTKLVADTVFARERGETVEGTDGIFRDAVDAVVARQADTGIDIVSDGEMSKISYATYIGDRVTGFGGDSDREPPRDLEDYPGYLTRLASSGGTPTYRRPCCIGEIAVKDMGPVTTDISNFKAALERHNPVEGFMNAASPGVIALFQPNKYYPSHEAYLYALADAMSHEYRAIVDAGLVLQLDSPDLGLGRHMMFKDRPDDEYRRLASLHVEALNHAIRDLPRDRVRLHICWGNYEGPHHYDAPLEMVLPIALQAAVGALLFESSNPRHAHEWEVVASMDLPEELILIPGMIDSTTNFVEHPRLVAQRILRYADIVGRERVMAGTDCGFSTFAGFGAVDEDIVYAKLGSLVEGAVTASEALWG